MLIPQIQVLLGAKDGFLKRQAHVHLQVRPSPRPTITSATTATTKEHVKEIIGVQFRSAAAIGKVKGTVLEATTAKRITAALLKVGIDTGMSVLIVEIALLFIRQHFVGFRGFFEFVVRGVVALSQIPKQSRGGVRSVRYIQGEAGCDLQETHLVGIGVILFSQLEVGLFNGGLVGPSIDTEDVVKIFLAAASGGEGARLRKPCGSSQRRPKGGMDGRC